MLRTPLFALVAATLLAGCGQAGLVASSATAAKLSGANAGNVQGKPGARGPEGQAGFGLMGLDLQDLALTDDQKTRLKALMEANKPSARPSHDANATDPEKALRDAVLADTVDDAALRAALAARESAEAAHAMPSPADQLVAVRAILTDDQRAKIIAKLQAAPAPKARPSADASPKARPSDDAHAEADDKLALTDDQKAKLDALKAAFKPASSEPTDRNAAMIAFWQTGDASGLAAPARPAFPTEAFVAAVEALSLDQRKALFGRELMGFGGMGGRGGFGGHGGPGGRPEMGGQGRPEGGKREGGRPDGTASGAPAGEPGKGFGGHMGQGGPGGESGKAGGHVGGQGGPGGERGQFAKGGHHGRPGDAPSAAPSPEASSAS